MSVSCWVIAEYVLRKAFLHDGTELRISPGKAEKLVRVDDLVGAAVTIRVNAESLGESCVTLRDGTLV